MISRDDFDAIYKPRESPSGEPVWTWDEVQAAPLTHVWTVVTGDNGEDEYASPGYHIVNKVGYVVTEVPWPDDTTDAVWYAHDDETCAECGEPMTTIDHSITHHLNAEGEIDFDRDADHVAYRDAEIDGPLADDGEDDE
jgi:hypothetical protein